MIIVIGFFAILAGLIATTGSPIPVLLMVGLMGGIALLMAPRLSIWMLLVFGLVSGFFVSLGPEQLTKFPWILTLLSMLLLLPAAVKFVESKNIPSFIWIALVFMIFTLFSTIVQWYSLPQLVAGFKRYFQMYGLMFALALIVFRPDDYKRWLKLLLIIALAQLPFALFEHFVLMGIRIDRGVGVADATDVVAGTLGANMEGGSANAEMAAFLIMAMAFLIARWKEGLIQKRRVVWMCLLCLLPLGLGETKVVVLLLPLVWLILMRDNFKKNAGQFLIQFLGLLFVTSIFGAIYFSMNENAGGEVLGKIIDYNFGDVGYGTSLLNRTTVISFWWNNQSWNDPLGFLLGHGLGSSFSAEGNLVPGNIAVQYGRYGIDLTAASSLLWDTGLMGLSLFLAIFVAAWFAAVKLRKSSESTDVRADALAIQACIAVFLSYVFYDYDLVNYLPFEVIAAAVLGYLGYLVRNNNLDSTVRITTSAKCLKY